MAQLLAKNSTQTSSNMWRNAFIVSAKLVIFSVVLQFLYHYPSCTRPMSVADVQLVTSTRT